MRSHTHPVWCSVTLRGRTSAYCLAAYSFLKTEVGWVKLKIDSSCKRQNDILIFTILHEADEPFRRSIESLGHTQEQPLTHTSHLCSKFGEISSMRQTRITETESFQCHCRLRIKKNTKRIYLFHKYLQIYKCDIIDHVLHNVCKKLWLNKNFHATF